MSLTIEPLKKYFDIDIKGVADSNIYLESFAKTFHSHFAFHFALNLKRKVVQLARILQEMEWYIGKFFKDASFKDFDGHAKQQQMC